MRKSWETFDGIVMTLGTPCLQASSPAMKQGPMSTRRLRTKGHGKWYQTQTSLYCITISINSWNRPGTGEWTAPSAEGNNRLPHQRGANVVRRLVQSGSSKIGNLPQRLDGLHRLPHFQIQSLLLIQTQQQKSSGLNSFAHITESHTYANASATMYCQLTQSGLG